MPRDKMTRDGVLKLLDFGLAKAAEESEASLRQGTSPTISPSMSPGMTQAGMILGTAAYMAPEQARRRHAVDKRTDIWAFGAVISELLTGARLFHGGAVSDTLAGVLRADIDFEKLHRRYYASCFGNVLTGTENGGCPTRASVVKFSLPSDRR